MVIELRVVQFWSEIILVIEIELALRARSMLKSRVGFQTKLHFTQFNYHFKCIETYYYYGMLVDLLLASPKLVAINTDDGHSITEL